MPPQASIRLKLALVQNGYTYEANLVSPQHVQPQDATAMSLFRVCEEQLEEIGSVKVTLTLTRKGVPSTSTRSFPAPDRIYDLQILDLFRACNDFHEQPEKLDQINAGMKRAGETIPRVGRNKKQRRMDTNYADEEEEDDGEEPEIADNMREAMHKKGEAEARGHNVEKHLKRTGMDARQSRDNSQREDMTPEEAPPSYKASVAEQERSLNGDTGTSCHPEDGELSSPHRDHAVDHRSLAAAARGTPSEESYPTREENPYKWATDQVRTGKDQCTFGQLLAHFWRLYVEGDGVLQETRREENHPIASTH